MSEKDDPLIMELIQRVTRLEERTSAIEKFMDNFQDRLDKLEKSLEKVDGRIWAVLSGIAVSIIIQILIGVL